MIFEVEEENIEKYSDDNSLNVRYEYENLKKVSPYDTGIFELDCPNNVNLKNEEEMKKQLASLTMLAATMTTQLSAQTNYYADFQNNNQQIIENPSGDVKPFQFSFIYPLSSDWVNSTENSYKFSLNMIGGITGRVNGVELGSVFNINKYSVRGAQFAGGFNLSGYGAGKEESNVTQFAGLFNYVGVGAANQFAGGINFTERGIVQAAGVINIGKDVKTQLGGGINIVQSTVFQAAGAINIARESSAQLAGGINITQKAGFQGAGGINVAKESTCQLAPINVTGKGGFQLGVINVRDTVDGVSVGLLNIVKRGGIKDVGIEGGEFVHAALTFRSGTERFYSVISAGWNFSEELLAIGAGFGTSFSFNSWLGLNLELVYHQLHDSPWDVDVYTGLAQLRPMIDFRIARHFKVFVGPTANLLIQNRKNDTPFIKTPYKSIYNKTVNDTQLDGWLGFTAGMRF